MPYAVRPLTAKQIELLRAMREGGVLYRYRKSRRTFPGSFVRRIGQPDLIVTTRNVLTLAKRGYLTLAIVPFYRSTPEEYALTDLGRTAQIVKEPITYRR